MYSLLLNVSSHAGTECIDASTCDEPEHGLAGDDLDPDRETTDSHPEFVPFKIQRIEGAPCNTQSDCQGHGSCLIEAGEKSGTCIIEDTTVVTPVPRR